MNRIFYINFLLILVGVRAYGQQSADYEFLGTLQITGGELITYKLVFNEIGENKISGTSTTDLFGPDKTSSKIVGTLSSDKSKITVRETENIYTKSSAHDSVFCYIHITNARIKHVANKRVIQGRFVGKYRSGEKCITGNVYLIGADFADSIVKSMNLLVSQNPNDSVKKLLGGYSQKISSSGNNELKKNELLSINWPCKDVTIELWDGRAEDGDVVSLLFNGAVVLDKAVINQQKKTVSIPLVDKINLIKIVADGEGNQPPCTVDVIVRCDSRKQSVRAVLNKSENAVIKLNN